MTTARLCTTCRKRTVTETGPDGRGQRCDYCIDAHLRAAARYAARIRDERRQLERYIPTLPMLRERYGKARDACEFVTMAETMNLALNHYGEALA